MKEIIKKVFSKKVTTPVFVIFGFLGVLNFIVFPGLTTADTGSNIVSALLAVVTLAFLFYYIDSFKLMDPPKVEPGETELDYINPEELKPKRKRNSKQFPEVKSEEPFVKTRKKKKTEFPLPPHHPTKKK